MKLIDITGQKFGRLTVTGYAGPCAYGGSEWLCNCDCGTQGIKVRSLYLRNGHTESCGCVMYERRLASNITHGMAGSVEHNTWKGIVQRCTNPKYKEFYLYGGRGIRMCNRWRHSFQAFFDDMGRRPGNKFSIERIDVNGNYEPSNCVWATTKQQGRNRRDTLRFLWNGTVQSLADICESCGANYKLVYHRIKEGWPVGEAVSLPRLQPHGRSKL